MDVNEPWSDDGRWPRTLRELFLAIAGLWGATLLVIVLLWVLA